MPSRTFRSNRQTLGLLGGLFVFAALIAIAVGRSGSVVGLIVGLVIFAPVVVLFVRAARAALVVDGDQVEVRGPLRTRTFSLNEIEGFMLGRQGVLGSICLIRLQGGEQSVPVFAIQGITGRPDRPASVTARSMVDELNRMISGTSVGG